MGIYKSPDSKKWWISYYLNGERVREGVSTNKREAEKVLMQRLTAINENKHPVLQKRKNKKIRKTGTGKIFAIPVPFTSFR
jgi:hypothetical protein